MSKLFNLFYKVANNIKIEDKKEVELLERIAWKFDKEIPEAACFNCWLKRILEEIRERF